MRSTYALLAVVVGVAAGRLRPGVISYWDPSTTDFNTIPSGTLAVINPNSGMFVSETSYALAANVACYAFTAEQLSIRGATVLGYVPTGYFNHGCNTEGVCQTWQRCVCVVRVPEGASNRQSVGRIEANIAAYYSAMPMLDGIFFDEAAPSSWDCNAFAAEFAQLRALVYKYTQKAQIAYNIGIADTCIVPSMQGPNEIYALFESSMTDFTSQKATVLATIKAANSAGLQTWALVYSVTSAQLPSLVQAVNGTSLTWFYATDIGGNWQAGQNTWGAPPAYWGSELALLT